MRRFALAVLLAGCSGPTYFPVPASILTINARYDIAPTLTTPEGVRVDPSGQSLPVAYLAKIDRITDEAFACTGKPRVAVTLKIPADWKLNCDETQQVLPVKTYGCDPNKPESADPRCTSAPCYWRAIVRDDGAIVSTPSLYVYKDPLVRMLTGVQAVWSDPVLAPCAAPTSTGPLDTLDTF